MKRTERCVSIAMALLFMFQIGICGFAESEVSVILIKSAEDLNAVRNKLDGNYVLENDIDLSAFENWIPIGTKEAPFTGTFDGGNHKISNIKITDIGENEYAGLFGYAKFAEISGVNISGEINITAGNASAAGVCAFAEESDINRCLNNVNISVKSNDSESMISAGGITGNLYKGTVTECSNTGNICAERQNMNAFLLAGGIAGRAEGEIKDCRNAGNIKTFDNSDNNAAGGIVGFFRGIVNAGEPGIMGEKFKGYLFVHNVCNTGSVNSSSAEGSGPIVGMQDVWSLNTYNPDEPELYSGCYYLDSCVESSYSNSDFKSFNTENGQKKETFPEFDFKNVWTMSEGCFAPVLKFEAGNKLIEVKFVSIPLKNRVVFTGGSPESPAKIKVKLIYEDGSKYAEEIRETEKGYYVGNERLSLPASIDTVRYGILSTALYFSDGEISASYRYLSLPEWMGFLRFRGF